MHFPPPRPDHRFLAIKKAVQDGTFQEDDPVADAVARILQKDHNVPSEVLYAARIYSDPYKKEVFEAFFVAGGGPEDIERILLIERDVTEVYLQIFFDADVFQDRLDVESYVHRYPTEHDDGYGKEVKMFALEMGLEYMSTVYSRGEYVISSDKALQEMISQAYILSKVRYGARLDSPGSKESRQWALTLINSIRTLPEIQESTSTAKDELRIKLMMVKQPDGRDEVDPDDIIHVSEDDEG